MARSCPYIQALFDPLFPGTILRSLSHPRRDLSSMAILACDLYLDEWHILDMSQRHDMTHQPTGQSEVQICFRTTSVFDRVTISL